MKRAWFTVFGLLALSGCMAEAADEDRTAEVAQDMVAGDKPPPGCPPCRWQGGCVWLDRLAQSEDGATLHRWVTPDQTPTLMSAGWTLEQANDFALSASQGPSADRKAIYDCEIIVMYPVFPDVPPPPPFIRDFLSDDPACGGDPDAQSGPPIGWLETSQMAGTLPIFELTNAAISDHYFTRDAAAANSLVTSAGYTLQGVLGYHY